MQRLCPDPLGARRRPRSRTTFRARRRTSISPGTIAKIFMGQITTGTTRRSRSSTRREHARPEDHPGLPLGQFGHDLQLHRLPVAVSPALEVEGRQLDRGQLPDRHRRARLRRCRRARLAHRRRDHLRRRRVRREEPPEFAAVQNAPGSSSSRACAASGCSGGVHRGAGENEMHIVNPPKSAPLAYPISTYTYISCRRRRARGRAAEAGLLGADPGPGGEYTAKLCFVPLPKVGSSRPRRR